MQKPEKILLENVLESGRVGPPTGPIVRLRLREAPPGGSPGPLAWVLAALAAAHSAGTGSQDP